MGACGPQRTRIAQILGRVQAVEGSAETLIATDGKTLLQAGAAIEYDAPREKRDIARNVFTKPGSIEGKKALNPTFSTEMNTPDTFVIAATADMVVSAINWQSDNIVRVSFSGTPDLSAVYEGQYLNLNYCVEAPNNGCFVIVNVDDTGDYIDVIIREVTTAATDETTGGIGDVQNNLEEMWAINASGGYVKGLSQIAVGAITSGPFRHGETITFTGSGATGICVVPAKNGDTYLYYYPVTGKAVSGDTAIVGSDSSASAALSSAAPTISGYYAVPKSNCQDFATIRYEEDGYQWSARDAMGNAVFTFAANAQAFSEFVFTGPRLSKGDLAFTSGVVRANEDPPVMKIADLKLDADEVGEFEPVFSQVVFDMGNEIVLRENGNAGDDTGYEGARMGDRNPTVTISLEHELASAFDYFGKYDAGTKMSMEHHVGTSETKQIWAFFEELEIQSVGMGDNEGLRTLDIETACTGSLASASGDNEWMLAWIGN